MPLCGPVLSYRKVLQTFLYDKKQNEHSHDKKMSAKADRARLGKAVKSLTSEGFRELMQTCLLCSSLD